MSLNSKDANPFLSGGKSRWFSLSFLVDDHPTVEVRHNVQRASLRRVLERLSQPSCETVQSPRRLLGFFSLEASTSRSP